MRFALEPWEEQAITEMMTRADSLLAISRLAEARDTYAEARRVTTRLRGEMVASFARLGGAGGLVAGLLFPGVSNIVGAVVGGAAGEMLFKYLAGNVMYGLDVVIEKAIAGKVRAEELLQRQNP